MIVIIIIQKKDKQKFEHTWKLENVHDCCYVPVGWKETVKKLVDRFEEVTLGPGTPPNGEEHPDSQLENGLQDEDAVQNHRNLYNAVRNSTGQDANLNKLRTHYHKVELWPFSICQVQSYTCM